jgi:predicted transcriptional regulator
MLKDNNTMKNSERFLNAFVTIEKYLRNKCNLDQGATFSQLLDVASSKSMPEIKRHKDDLKEYGELRNAIVHDNRGDGYVIAEPNTAAVESIEKIRDLIKRPPLVFPLLKSSVLSYDINDSIGSALKEMTGKNFSQVPVLNNGKFKALLTTDTIARWLGSNADDDIFSLKETTIGHVLKFTEDPDNFKFVSRNMTLFKVLDFFDNYEKQGKRLDALLITETGNQNEKILGIITISDLPKILREIK